MLSEDEGDTIGLRIIDYTLDCELPVFCGGLQPVLTFKVGIESGSATRDCHGEVRAIESLPVDANGTIRRRIIDYTVDSELPRLCLVPFKFLNDEGVSQGSEWSKEVRRV